MKTTEQLRQQVISKVASPVTFEVFEQVLSAMDFHDMEATDAGMDEGILVIEWLSTFNLGNIVTMAINEDGTILCIAMGSSVKVWTVDTHAMNHPSLRLSLAETMEYIRHFIWTNHNV